MMLKYYTKRYEVIKQGAYPTNRKKRMLATLVSDMEAAYAIPMQRDLTWEKENEEVFSLYRQVSADKELFS
ncbi:hypothetical protein ACQKDD_13320 [Planococcus kocurii]|uniref:Uncharacterized protein n=1 Tax=Planococcus kocurii TaxID=1374 RepID=A0ABM5WWQ1_9BACL|nr:MULTISPECIES: hypothetical protein [Planococcus]ALS78759.1 hypothetical protein AUO94_08870 [Planococcus kocurii]KAA0955202.1 hypothetical protein FQ085_16150 [Planococcus sp. ANT_H30]